MSATLAPLVEVRQPATYEDADPVRIGEMNHQLDPAFPNEPLTVERFAEYDGTHAALLVAYIGGRAVGMASMTKIVETGIKYGFLGGFITHEDSRGQGVGTAVWKAMLGWCRQEELPFFMFHTEPERAAAIGLYESLGAVQLDGTKHLIYAAEV